MLNQIGSLEKTVVRGGDKTRKLEYVRIIAGMYMPTLLLLIRLFVSPTALPLQETMVKIKQCIVEEKKDVRFGTWSAAEVEE